MQSDPALPGRSRCYDLASGPSGDDEQGYGRPQQPSTHPDGNSAVKVQINPERCQGHGRCCDLAPGVFSDDDEGYGKVLADGTMPPGKEHGARLAAANCPEHAIELLEEMRHGRR